MREAHTRRKSYKGVVLNGDGGRQGREQEYKEYVGKGKGKMYEENRNTGLESLRRIATKTTLIATVTGVLGLIDQGSIISRSGVGHSEERDVRLGRRESFIIRNKK
ncbi:unnamed protein product [Eruca vesicaria subsp. sativa]|uniref:Uncharacterized protein n=1 Tax=Eruca vesicaria subsp. sativa TaxID=29727 RepID=A0ABC8L5Z3_ERUVS|nr:unnamed protein product [Eruca vesicaria subsp. sativa]